MQVKQRILIAWLQAHEFSKKYILQAIRLKNLKSVFTQFIEPKVRGIKSYVSFLDDLVRFQSLLQHYGISYHLLAESNFWNSLAVHKDAPLGMFIFGDEQVLERKDQKFVSVVGTRRPSLGAVNWLKSILRQISVLHGYTTVSGFAVGVDKGSMYYSQLFGMPHVAVLPALTKEALATIQKHLTGILYISEYALAFDSLQHYHFVRRNRIIAGLGSVTVVAEAPLGSGAIITANYAKNYGKPVFFRPSCGYKNLGSIIQISKYNYGYLAYDALDIVFHINEQDYDELLSKTLDKVLEILPNKIGKVLYANRSRTVRLLKQYRLDLSRVIKQLLNKDINVNNSMIELVSKKQLIFGKRTSILNLNQIFND